MGIHFRSSNELRFLMINVFIICQIKSAELFSIPYVYNGIIYHYHPDFIIGRKIFEIKRPGWEKDESISSIVKLNREAGEKWCLENGYEYVFIDYIKHICNKEFFKHRRDGLITLKSNTERKYNEWMVKHTN